MRTVHVFHYIYIMIRIDMRKRRKGSYYYVRGVLLRVERD